MKLIDTGLCVEIDAEAMECIRTWTRLARGEFSCLGLVTDDLFITSVHLFPQTCTDSSTELDPEALAHFLADCPTPELVRGWIHSHGQLRTFWSQTDDQCIEGLANESFLVSIVVNKAGSVRCRLDVFRPIRLTLDELPLVVRVRNASLAADCQREFHHLVREVTPTPTFVGRMLPGGFEDWPFEDPREARR